MDLGSNFHSHRFWDFCEHSSIEVKYISVAHPWANGHVEHANGLVLDGLKKRLYNKNSKKDSKWINEISSVISGLCTQPSKVLGGHLSSLYTGLKLYYQLMSYGSLLDWRCMKKARLTTQDISNLTQLRKSDATSCSSRPATYKESIITRTETFNDALSTLEDWFFDESRVKLGCTSLSHDGRGLSSCTRLQDLDRPRRSSIYAIFILSQPRHLLSAPGDQNFQYNSVLLVYN
jgi:hypothetical protein